MKRILLPLGVCLLVTPVFADSHVGQVSINPFVGYSVPDSKRDLNDSVTYGVNFEYRITSNWAAQIYYNTSGTEVTGDPTASDDSTDYQKYGISALYYFMPEAKLQPYLVLGAGAGEYESDNNPFNHNDNDTQVNLGAGVRYFITHEFSVNGELTNAHSYGDDYNDQLVSLGVSYAFGGSKAKPAPKPAPAPVAAPMDSDMDGVIDAEDKCPDTATGLKVDATGCPLDSDHDGVSDDKDACPGTPAGTKVDSHGCKPKKMTVESIRLNIQFPTNSAVVPEKYQPEIKKVADFLTKFPDTSVTIEGHSDSQGAAKYNQALSQRRADSVKQQLITRYGIAADRVNAIGYGESKPIATNDTAAGRAQNRRVVAVMQKEVME